MADKITDPIAAFEAEKRENIASYREDADWQALSLKWSDRAFRKKYMYNFAWLGRPIIQIPTDIVATQEIIWAVKPDLIIETGIAHGGSLVLSASLLALLELGDAEKSGTMLDPKKPRRKVLGIDIDIRQHNLDAIRAHPMSSRIDMIEGSSLSQDVIGEVRKIAAGHERVMVFLDSNHTHDHVMAELEAYAPLTAKGSYCVVFDTIVEDLPADMFPGRPWAPGNNPKTAVRDYLQLLNEEGRVGADGAPLNFERDAELENKLMISVAPEGYLKRV